MSRKSKRNRPPQAPQAAAAAAIATSGPSEGRTGKLLAIAIAVATLVIAGVLAVKLAGGGKPAPQADAARALALASNRAPSTGAADARVHIVEFLDPACGTCAMFYPIVKKIMAENPGRIRLSVRHVAFHKGADEAVRVLEAARSQGRYFETLEALLANQAAWVHNHRVVAEAIPGAIAAAGLDAGRLRADMAAAQVDENMKADMADARTLSVTRTPEYFVNGSQMREFGVEELRALIAAELRRAYP